MPIESSKEMIVRDADMLESLGQSGVARHFIGSGMMNRETMDLDPNATPEAHASRKWVIETLERRAHGISKRLYTQTARHFAQELGLVEYVQRFVDQFRQESRFAMMTFGQRSKKG